METYFKLYFLTDLGKNTNIKVPDASESVPASSVKAVMDSLSASGLVKSKQGIFTSNRKAQLVKVQTVSYTV